MKDEFLKIFKLIKRDGADKLLTWLESSDFFTAPASSKYHMAVEGGLLCHSVNVYKKLVELIKLQFGKDYAKRIPEESIAICGLLHDICKVDYYDIEMRNVKRDGAWVQEPFYKVNEKLPYGHGEKSVYIVNGFMRLTRDEAMAINWHMGGFDSRVGSYSMQIGEAYKKYPLAILLHMADIGATYLDENHDL